MEQLREIFAQDRYTILSEGHSKDGRSMNVLVPWIQVDTLNANHRKYPRHLIQREIDRVQKDIAEGGFLGSGDHPKSGLADLESISHIVRKLWLDESGRGWAEMKVLPTERGLKIQTIIREGGRLGISARGFGTVDERTREVRSDYQLAGVDIVTNPSFKTATFTKENIFESVDFREKEDVMEEFKSLDKLCLLNFNRDADEGRFRGGFEDWKKENEIFVKAAILEVTEGIELSHALEKLGRHDLAEKLLNKAPIKKFTVTEIMYEALACGLAPQTYADKLNEQIERKNVNKSFPLSAQMTENILREASQAGVNIAIAEEREKYLETYRKQQQKSQAAKARKETNLTAEELAEREKKKKEEIREKKISSLVKELTAAGGSSEKIRQIVNESLKEV